MSGHSLERAVLEPKNPGQGRKVRQELPPSFLEAASLIETRTEASLRRRVPTCISLAKVDDLASIIPCGRGAMVIVVSSAHSRMETDNSIAVSGNQVYKRRAFLQLESWCCDEEKNSLHDVILRQTEHLWSPCDNGISNL
jgi:hypothetical protein